MQNNINTKEKYLSVRNPNKEKNIRKLDEDKDYIGGMIGAIIEVIICVGLGAVAGSFLAALCCCGCETVYTERVENVTTEYVTTAYS